MYLSVRPLPLILPSLTSADWAELRQVTARNKVEIFKAGKKVAAAVIFKGKKYSKARNIQISKVEIFKAGKKVAVALTFKGNKYLNATNI